MSWPQNLKNLSMVLTKQLFLLSSVKTIGRFFQFFAAFSEKLDFKNSLFELHKIFGPHSSTFEIS